MKRLLLIFITCWTCVLFAGAQGFGYELKVDLGNGLYKVKSGDYYGIVDRNDDVLVSVEFHDICFRDGKALLIKDDDILYGTIDMSGKVTEFKGEYKVHPIYCYVYEGRIPVAPITRSLRGNKWGYINEEEVPFRLLITKIKGTMNRKQSTLFDDVAPFVDGYACVYTKRAGWKHVDKEGRECFILPDKEEKALFRSSVYQDECIIVSEEEGIKVYQENEDHQAVVKRILAASAKLQERRQVGNMVELVYDNGVLTVDSLQRAVRFRRGNDSIVFIEPPRKAMVEEPVKPVAPVDVQTLDESLTVALSSKVIQANAQGKASLTVKVKNNSDAKFEAVSIELECAGAVRNWLGDIAPHSEASLSFTIPARFSSAQIRRVVKVFISCKNDSMTAECPVTVKRYTPVRSR